MGNILDRAGTSIGNAYKLIGESPLDVRFVVADKEELKSIADANGTYPGLEVWVEEDQKKYIAIHKTRIENEKEKLEVLWEVVPSRSDTYTKEEVDNLIAPALVMRGTLGTNATITSLPDAKAETLGDMYKVITKGTYNSISAKVGDVFVCCSPKEDTYEWILIPAGDEPGGTVTSITVGDGLTTSNSNATITSSGEIKLNGTTKNSLAKADKAILYDSQALTDNQKEQARKNIGAGTSNLIIGDSSTEAAAGNHTHNYAASKTAGGAATSAEKLTTARTMTLKGAISGTSESFDGSKDIAITTNSLKESYLEWGGKNLSNSYSPTDASMIPELGANRLAFFPASNITLEYSRDNGQNWTELDNDDTKAALFSTSGSISIGNSSPADYDQNNAGELKNYKCRVTLRFLTDKGISLCYTNLSKFAIYISSNGSGGCYCTIQARTVGNKKNNIDTWKTFSEETPISGWSGWNIINTSNIITAGSETSENQYGELRFVFGITDHPAEAKYVAYDGLKILKIMGFGGFGWKTPSNAAQNGHVYASDSQQNVIFPKRVSADSMSADSVSADSVSVKRIGVTDTSAAKHISFARNNFNYICASQSDAKIGFIVGESSVGSEYSAFTIQPKSVVPGTSNKIDIGGSGKRFKDLYLSGKVSFAQTGKTDIELDYDTMSGLIEDVSAAKSDAQAALGAVNTATGAAATAVTARDEAVAAKNTATSTVTQFNNTVAGKITEATEAIIAEKNSATSGIANAKQSALGEITREKTASMAAIGEAKDAALAEVANSTDNATTEKNEAIAAKTAAETAKAEAIAAKNTAVDSNNGALAKVNELQGLVKSAGNEAENTIVSRAATGQINSEKLAITSSGTVKATWKYNSSTDCIELVW